MPCKTCAQLCFINMTKLRLTTRDGTDICGEIFQKAKSSFDETHLVKRDD